MNLALRDNIKNDRDRETRSRAIPRNIHSDTVSSVKSAQLGVRITFNYPEKHVLQAV